jgi:type II secretory pathway pseudopilin PulG
MKPLRSERGLVLLALLLMLALLGIALLGQAQSWSASHRREAERELLWVGAQYRKAIESYYYATPGQAKALPTRLEDLLEDRRSLVPLHHLRRLYRDPVSGGELTPLLAGIEIIGVASSSDAKPFKRNGFDTPGFDDKDRYADWEFVFRPPPRPGPSAAAANRARAAAAPHSVTAPNFSSGAKP